jgi:signal transduction histidine kinase
VGLRLRDVLKVLRTDTVGARLLGAFFLVSIVPVAIAGLLVYRTGQQTLREELDERLATVTHLRTQQIHTWLNGRRQDVIRPSLYRDFRRQVAAMAASPRPAPALVENVREVLEQNRVSGGLTEMFLLSMREGVVMVSTDPPEQEGTIKADRPYEQGTGPVAQHLYYSMARGGTVLAFSTPVMGPDNTPVAVLVGRVDLRFLDVLMAERAGLGTTGRTFLINRYNYFVSASLGSGKDGYQPVFSEGIKQALAGDSGTAVYKSHDGRAVVGAYGQIPELGYVIFAEMDTEEAFAPVYRFRIAIAVLFVIVCAAALLIGIRLAWGISRPIKRLAEAAAAIGEGDLDHRVTIDGAREVTSLAKAFNAMAEHLARSRAELVTHSTVLAKRNAELDSFTYSVSHDLKAPLVTIQAMCGMVLEDEGERLSEDGRRVLTRIEANAQHMAQLIADLLALSRVDREARMPEAVAVQPVVETVLERLGEQIRLRGVEIDVKADTTVWGIRVHLEQVFANLVSNAVKYVGPTDIPRVEIRAEDADDGFVEFSVRDNGIGIDPEYHARVFELFQRLRDVEAEGTGVGLALVKKMVDTAGGRIWVESTPGHGATFRFTWPAAANARAS